MQIMVTFDEPPSNMTVQWEMSCICLILICIENGFVLAYFFVKMISKDDHFGRAAFKCDHSTKNE